MFKSIGNPQIDHLNAISLEVAKHDDVRFGALSTGEKCYVALAANRVDLLQGIGYTIPEAIDRLGAEWQAALVYCWQFAGNPANYE